MSIPSWAVPGAKVVCVRAPNTAAYAGKPYFSQNVTVGGVYIIRHVAVVRTGVGLWFEEVRNPRLNDGVGLRGETGFHVEDFRPVVNDTTEATLFRAKHQPVRNREAERA